MFNIIDALKSKKGKGFEKGREKRVEERMRGKEAQDYFEKAADDLEKILDREGIEIGISNGKAILVYTYDMKVISMLIRHSPIEDILNNAAKKFGDIPE